MRHIQTLDRLAPVTDSRETVVAQTLRQQSRTTWSLEWFSDRTSPETADLSAGAGAMKGGFDVRLHGGFRGSLGDRYRSFGFLPTSVTPGCGMLTISDRRHPQNPRCNPVPVRAGFAKALAKRDGARLEIC